MLKPVFGRSGSGKTTFVLEQVKKLAKEGKSVMVIVPEQFSFEMEKAVYRTLGRGNTAQVEVYSFTRLCRKVFSVCGGIAGENVTDAAKQILMSISLDQCRDQLSLYSKPAASISFVSSMLKAVEEFKNAGVRPQQLKEFTGGDSQTSNHNSAKEEAPGSPLMQKVKELGTIYHIYQAMLEASFIDEKDSLMRCCQLLEGLDFFEGYTILVDSFMTFMAGEVELLRRMLESCTDLYLVMTADKFQEEVDTTDSCHSYLKESTKKDSRNSDDDRGTFDVVKETAHRMIKAAKQAGQDISEPLILTETYRFKSLTLKYLEQHFPSSQLVPYTELEDISGVKIVETANPFEEVQFVASEIARLTKDGKIRFGEVAVIARDTAPYVTAIEDVFPKYDLPYFMDQRETVQTIPVAAAVLSALDAVRGNYDTQHLLALGKSTLFGLDCADVARLENYCFIWSVNHKQWLDEVGFQNNPRGLVEEFTTQDKAELEIIQQTAKQLVEPVRRLKDRMEDCTGGEFSRAMFDFLLDIGARENMTNYQEKIGETYDRYTQLNQGAWDVIIDLLDVFYTTLGQIYLPRDRLIELFRMAVLTADLGSIPPTLDQISIGAANRIRPNKPKITFVIGANQGEFPPQLSEGGLFTDQERDILLEGGIRLNPSLIKWNNYETFFVYSALTSPSDQLIVTYHRAQLTGELTPKSSIITDLEALFPGITTTTRHINPEQYIANPRTAFDVLCGCLREDTPLTAALVSYIRSTEDTVQGADFRGSSNSASYSKRLDYAISLLQGGGFRIQEKEIARMLFGDNIRLSPSKVEHYFLCPFSYFCKDSLGLKPRRKVELSPLQSGNIIHFVLEKMVSRYGGKGLANISRQQLKQEIEELLKSFLEDRITQEEVLSQRFKYLFARLANSLTRLLMQLGTEFAQSEYEPYGFEVPIRKGEEIPPLELCTADGNHVIVEGIVDRVDKMEKDGKCYVRVVDYKSGSKEFKLDDVYYGLNLQMLIYLCAIWHNGKAGLENCLPGGVLYLPARDNVIPAKRDTTETEIEKEHRKRYKMSGLLLNDPASISGMEEKTEGVFIPAKTKKDGSLDARSSVASLAQMGYLKRHIETLLRQMTDQLRNGNIDAQPADGLGYKPCEYCDFTAICQHQENDAVRTISALGRKNFFDQLAGETSETDASEINIK